MSQTKFSPVVYIVFELVKLIGLYQVNLHSICFTRKISVMFKNFKKNFMLNFFYPPRSIAHNHYSIL